MEAEKEEENARLGVISPHDPLVFGKSQLERTVQQKWCCRRMRKEEVLEKRNATSPANLTLSWSRSWFGSQAGPVAPCGFALLANDMKDSKVR